MGLRQQQEGIVNAPSAFDCNRHNLLWLISDNSYKTWRAQPSESVLAILLRPQTRSIIPR